MADETTTETPETPQKKGPGALGWVAAVAGGAGASKLTTSLIAGKDGERMKSGLSKGTDAAMQIFTEKAPNVTPYGDFENMKSFMAGEHGLEKEAAAAGNNLVKIWGKSENFNKEFNAAESGLGKFAKNTLAVFKGANGIGKAGIIFAGLGTAVALGAIIKKVRNRGHAEAVEADRAQNSGEQQR